MAIWEKVPYTNFHDINLDWIITEMKGIRNDIDVLNEWKAGRDERDAEIDEQLADFERRFTALELLYNNFVEEVNGKFTELSGEITDQVDALETRVTDQVNALEADVYARLSETQAQIVAEMTAFKTDIQALLETYNIRIINVEDGLRRVIDELPDMFMILDPYTGEQNSIVNVIYEIVNNSKVNALTAADYDALALTASAYDALNVTAYNYDFHGSDYVH